MNSPYIHLEDETVRTIIEELAVQLNYYKTLYKDTLNENMKLREKLEALQKEAKE